MGIQEYLKKEPNLGIKYQGSGMVLRAESDASYTSEAKSRSRSGRYIYYGKKDDDLDQWTYHGGIGNTTVSSYVSQHARLSTSLFLRRERP